MAGEQRSRRAALSCDEAMARHARQFYSAIPIELFTWISQFPILLLLPAIVVASGKWSVCSGSSVVNNG